MDEITTDDIQRFLNEKEYLARNTVHTMLILVGEVLESAYEDKLIPVDPSKSKRIAIVSKRKKERDALKPEQLKAIIEGISALPAPGNPSLCRSFTIKTANHLPVS